MVMMVDAGAVAEEMAPSRRQKGRGRRNTSSMAAVTAPKAARASSSVMTMTLAPVSFSFSSLKYRPTPKAMKASAISVTKSIPSITLPGTRPRTYGPTAMPARIYPVTLGSRSFWVSLVARNPARSMMDSDSMISAAGLFSASRCSIAMTSFLSTGEAAPSPLPY